MGCIACAALVLDGAGVTLTRKESSSIPVEADSICPDRFVGLGQTQIAELPAYYGRRKVTLGDLFEVDGAGADNVTVSGDLKAVKKIGQGMSMGRVTVTGDVGPHLGAYMSGGEIVVEGNAGDWVGAHMSGGRIVVAGRRRSLRRRRLLGRDPGRAWRDHHRLRQRRARGRRRACVAASSSCSATPASSPARACSPAPCSSAAASAGARARA